MCEKCDVMEEKPTGAKMAASDKPGTDAQFNARGVMEEVEMKRFLPVVEALSRRLDSIEKQWRMYGGESEKPNRHRLGRVAPDTMGAALETAVPETEVMLQSVLEELERCIRVNIGGLYARITRTDMPEPVKEAAVSMSLEDLIRHLPDIVQTEMHKIEQLTGNIEAVLFPAYQPAAEPVR